MKPQGTRTPWIVVVFAAGMAWVEAASVYYLRVLVDRVDPYQEHPLPIQGILGEVELMREAATLVMLLTIGMLAARPWHKRLGYTALAFGVWDILYYVFLRLISGWPTSLFDWDLLFLLPLPWWGPVLAPVCIALLLIAEGLLVSQSADRSPASSVARRLWGLGAIGATLALYVFMADSLRAVSRGLDLTRQLPTPFNWPLFSVALALMAAPVAQVGWRWWSRQRRLEPASLSVVPRT